MVVQHNFAWKRCIKMYRFLQNWENLSYITSFFLYFNISKAVSLINVFSKVLGLSEFWKILLDYAVQSVISNGLTFRSKVKQQFLLWRGGMGLHSLVCPGFPAFPYFIVELYLSKFQIGSVFQRSCINKHLQK